MALKRCALVAIVAVAALVPATAASAARHHGRIRLALVPLQQAQLGSAGASLAINSGSGSIDDQSVIVVITSSSNHGQEISPLGGYALDYGDPYTGSTGVMEIRSSVVEYRTPAFARVALGFARDEDKFLDPFLSSPTVHVTVKKVKPVRVGKRRFGYLITKAAPNLNPMVKLDEQVAAGRFILDLTITAGSASAAEQIAPHLLLALRHRLFLALTEHQHGAPAKLPPQPQPGQAPGGPDLSTLILQPTDVGQPHAVNLIQTYVANPPTLSDFFMSLEPAGTYDGLLQQIAWWPSATEATYGEAYGGGFPDGFFFLALGGTVTPVDVSAAGDSATGYIIDGVGQSAAYVTLTNGQAGESVLGASKSTLQASDVQSLAEAAVNRLDAGLGP